MPEIGPLIASPQAGWMTVVVVVVSFALGTWRAFNGPNRKAVLASYHDEVCGYYRDRAERAEAERDRAYAKLDDGTRLLPEMAVTLKGIAARMDMPASSGPAVGPGTVRDVGLT
jgi:hypothetical protein